MLLRVILITFPLCCSVPAVAQSHLPWESNPGVLQADHELRWRGYQQPWWGNVLPWQQYEPRRRSKSRRSPAVRSGGPRPTIAPQAPDIVPFVNTEATGTVIIDTNARKLYCTLSDNEAYQYPISVGREGFTWTGTEAISRIADWPDWYPPADMRRRQPRLPKRMTGGIRNPLGVKALYLGDTLYRIHGTNDAKSIGQAASSGCFRMLNEHVVHLATLVTIGTTVKVVKRWPEEGVVDAGSENPSTVSDVSGHGLP